MDVTIIRKLTKENHSSVAPLPRISFCTKNGKLTVYCADGNGTHSFEFSDEEFLELEHFLDEAFKDNGWPNA